MAGMYEGGPNTPYKIGVTPTSYKSPGDKQQWIDAKTRHDEQQAREQAKEDLLAAQRREDAVFARNNAAGGSGGGTGSGGGGTGSGGGGLPGYSSEAGSAASMAAGNFDTFMSKYGRLAGAPSSSMSRTGGLSGGASSRVTLDTGAIDSADRAAYSKAKDQIGNSTQGLMKALQNQFGGRGLRGSSMESRAVGSGLEAAQGSLADVTRGQAIAAGDRATDLAKTQYEGGITQRGQDIGAETAMQSIQAQQQGSKLASIMGLYQAMNSGLRY